MFISYAYNRFVKSSLKNEHEKGVESMSSERKQLNNATLSTSPSPSLFGIFYQPREQFERIKNKPNFVRALIVVVILAVMSALFTLDLVETSIEDELGHLMVEQSKLFSTITKIATVIASAIVPIITILITATVYYIIGKIAHLSISFTQLFALFTFINLITFSGNLVNGMLTYLSSSTDPELLFTSLNVFVQASGALGVFLSFIEIFNIWSIILTAIGLQIVANFSKVLSWSLVIGFNVLIVFTSIFLTIVNQSFSIM